jgi:hypothetical protein
MEQGGKSMTQTNYGDYRGKGVKVLTSSKCRFEWTSKCLM